MASKNIIVLTGPTGVGKTDLSIDLAQRLGMEIVSADSRQFYREIPIGTAMPTGEQLGAVKHHFIGNLSVENDYNSGKYELDALSLSEELFTRYDDLLLVGGSGLYIDALCDGFDDLPQKDESLRAELNTTLEQSGLEALVERLRLLDPDSIEVIDIANPRRVMRALEVSILSGEPYSKLKGVKPVRPFNVIKIVVDRPTEELYERINMRVDIMMEQGLEQEARSVERFRGHNALQTVGYREMFDMFDGTTTREEAIELIKRNSRRYAKRQKSWFRRDKRYEWFSPGDLEQIIAYIEDQKRVCSKKDIKLFAH